MFNKKHFPVGGVAWVAWLAVDCRLRADEIPQEYQKPIEKGLDWLAKAQQRDGHWDATGGAYPVAMTGMRGLALLIERSTLSQGKYSNKIRKKARWLIGLAQRNSVNSPLHALRPTYLHHPRHPLPFFTSLIGS